jgi:hypothetical protein
MGRAARMATSSLHVTDRVPRCPQPNDLSRSLVALDQNSTIIAVIEMSQSSWLVAGMLPGIERQARKKLEPNPERLLGLLHRWQDEAVRAGRTITRIALAFEAGCDGFWLARWLARVGSRLTCLTSSVLKGLTGTSISLSIIRRSRCTTAELTIRGGGKPYSESGRSAASEQAM